MDHCQNTNATVILGDAIEEMQTLEPASVDAVVTDPPYGLDRHGQMLGQVSQNYHLSETHSRGYADNDDHAYQEWCYRWGQECLRVLRPGGHLLAFGGNPTWHRLTSGLQDAGFEVRDLTAWIHEGGRSRGLTLRDDDDLSTGWSTTMRPGLEIATLVRKPLSEPTVRKNVALHGTGALRVAAHSSPGRALALTGTADVRGRTNVFVDESVTHVVDVPSAHFVLKPTQAARPSIDCIKHPTVKPLALMRELVRRMTPDDGVVLDPFAGSGTTLEAAALEGFGYIGIERDPQYISLIEHRLARARAA